MPRSLVAPLAIFALALVQSLALGEGEPAAAIALPGPAPRARAEGHDPARANEACAACHADIADEWRGSMHKAAWEDPVFAKAYAIEPVAFCRSCHAPEADLAGEPPPGAQAVGVGCTTCHVQGDTVVGTRDVSAPHAVMADPRMATEAACGGCHQFDFPREPAPMQDTMREHASSSFATTPCQGCHMPMAQGGAGQRPHRSHRFSVIGDPSMIRRAAHVTASRPSARVTAITIAAAGAGHSFPTGDMFRRLEVRARAVGARGEALASARPVALGRTFADRPRDRETLGFHRVEAGDTRVPPPGAGAPVVVELVLPGATAAARVRWEVVYQRMGSAMAASFGVDAAIDEIVVAEGELDPFERGEGEQ